MPPAVSSHSSVDNDIGESARNETFKWPCALTGEVVAVRVEEAAVLAFECAVHRRVVGDRAAIPAGWRPVLVVCNDLYDRSVAAFDLIAVDGVGRVAAVIQADLAAARELNGLIAGDAGS